MSGFCDVNGKMKFKSRKEALQQLQSLMRKRRGKRECMKVYECPSCKNYHFGRNTKGGLDRSQHLKQDVFSIQDEAI